jgi:hypothetical protein
MLCDYAEWRILFIIMLNLSMLCVVMLNVVMLNVVLLNVVVLSVVLSVLTPILAHYIITLNNLKIANHSERH